MSTFANQRSTKLLKSYYGCRAPEYEKIYYRDDPLRQKEQAEIAAAMKAVFANRHVLELACGTGFWTALAAEVVESILAIDISEEMLAIAKRKNLPREKVTFRIADAYSLSSIRGTFDACLANFWLSHVPKRQLNNFLRQLHRKLSPGAAVFITDNCYVPGVGGQLVEKLGCQDTFKLRELSDGSQCEVLKNYYDSGQLHQIFAEFSSELRINIGDYFWWVSYRLPKARTKI